MLMFLNDLELDELDDLYKVTSLNRIIIHPSIHPSKNHQSYPSTAGW